MRNWSSPKEAIPYDSCRQCVAELAAAQDYFNRSTRNLREEDSTFTPAEGMMSAAQQVAHAAHTVGWFIEGAFNSGGFDLNFEEHANITMAYTSLAAAKAWLDREFETARSAVATKSTKNSIRLCRLAPSWADCPRSRSSAASRTTPLTTAALSPSMQD